MSYPTTGQEVYVSLNLSNTMLTGIGKGTITREEVSASYLKRLFAEHGVIVSAKPEQRRLLEIVNERYDLELEIPETLKLFQLTEEHRRLVVISVTGLRRKNGSLLPEYTEEEFDERVDAGKIGWLYIGGEMRFFDRFFSTMCKAEPAFAARAGVKLYGVESVTAEEGEGRLDHVHRRMRENGKIANRIRIRASVRVKDEVFTPGMFVRVHLPLPAACEQQSDIRIEALYPPNGRPAPEDALQRTVCWEETMTENHEFSVEYSYVHTARYHDVSAIEPDAAQPCFDTGEEAPHIIFTPYLRALVQALTEGVDSLLERARIFYDFITLNMKYTFMPAYFILENIAEAAARSYTGDCGVFALLFVTLCRCAGIPAQWQSGLTAEPDFCGGHDWARFYIAPYGWLYADPSYGIAAVRARNETRRRFYFGNLDPFRMAANSELQADFDPPKTQLRIDPFDNQRGEAEYADVGIRWMDKECDWKTIEMKKLS